jgi:hypothetical protein
MTAKVLSEPFEKPDASFFFFCAGHHAHGFRPILVLNPMHATE